MKKKTSKHTKPAADAWDDDAPVEQAPQRKVDKVGKEKPAEREARHDETHKVIARAAKRAGSKGLPAASVDDLIGDKPPMSQKMSVQAVTIDRGAYLSRHRYSAIVTGVVGGKVQVISMGANGITSDEMSQEKFAADFSIALPHYPLRRAARIYLDSPQPKDAKTERTLRSLLHA